MPPIKVLLYSFLIASLLSSCIRSSVNVRNTVANFPVEKTLCLGGLKSNSGVVDTAVRAKSPLVPPGESDFAQFLMPGSASNGAEIIVEAWCYGEAGEEVGYTRVTGGYRYGQPTGIYTAAPLRNTPTSPNCKEPVERRGEQMCIGSGAF